VGDRVANRRGCEPDPFDSVLQPEWPQERLEPGRRRIGERSRGGELGDCCPIDRLCEIGACSLQHQLGKEHVPRIAREPPGEVVPALCSIPAKESPSDEAGNVVIEFDLTLFHGGDATVLPEDDVGMQAP
jgi:hypothetical protein